MASSSGMRIVAMSDLHGYLPESVPAADLVILAGDVCPDTRWTARPALRQLAAREQANWLETTFAQWLVRLETGRVILCWGNHDYVGELPVEELPSFNADVVTDAEVSVAGLRLYAMPWTCTVPGVWAFDIRPSQLAERTALIPDGIDILVTHGPPRRVLDRIVTGERVGSEELAAAVARVRPSLHVFGHIHEARGRQQGSYNVAMVNERYRPYALPVTTIDL